MGEARSSAAARVRAGVTARARAGERGVALLVAVLATALLTVTVLDFTYSSQVAYRRAAHWLDAERARLAAESGVSLAVEVLAREGEVQERFGAQLAEHGFDARLWMLCLEPSPWTCNHEVASWCTWPLTVPGSDNDGETGAGPPGFFTVRISDETGLYNVNRLAGHQTPDEAANVAKLLRLADVDPALVGPIADWADTDSSPFAFAPGAEVSQYAAEGRDVQPRNDQFVTFHELALVLGVDTPALRKLRQVATVLPKNVDKINVNTAPLPVLQSLGPAFEDDELLLALQAQRCVRPFADATDLRKRVPQLETVGVPAALGYASTHFRVRSTAYVGDSVRSVEALLVRDGKNVEPTYLLAQRGANIADVDSPTTPGFDVPASAAGERS